MHVELRPDHPSALVAVTDVQPPNAAASTQGAFLNLPAPRLPAHRQSARAVIASLLFHAFAGMLVLLAVRGAEPVSSPRLAVQPRKAVPMTHMVFLVKPGPGGGVGGGGKRERAPASRAAGVGHDRLTLPVALPIVADSQPRNVPLPSQQIVLDVVPLAFGTAIQVGLPEGLPGLAASQGPGFGGGVGGGVGSRIGSGRGPGLGPGSGGGTGGGVYRPGNGVSAPVLLKEVKPTYTSEALRSKVQGSVFLEVIVLDDGLVGDIRVVRSLDPAGLDEQAIHAVRRWQFVPGRRGGKPVDVLVSIIVDFTLH